MLCLVQEKLHEQIDLNTKIIKVTFIDMFCYVFIHETLHAYNKEHGLPR